MNNDVYIRKLMQDIAKILEGKNEEFKKVYYILTEIIISMENKYNLQEEELIKQLELILKAVE